MAEMQSISETLRRRLRICSISDPAGALGRHAGWLSIAMSQPAPPYQFDVAPKNALTT
jgi:hypothetical protein